MTPELIWVNKEHQVGLFGFGFGSIIPSYLANPEAAEMVLPYLPPEFQQSLGPSIAGDIFSAGTILYELLTTIPAFVAETPEKTLERVLQEDPPPPRAIDTRIPSGFNDIIHTALHKNPAHRYPLASDLLTALKDKKLSDSIAVAKAVQEKTANDDVGKYLQRYAKEDDKRDSQVSAALSEWRQEEEIGRASCRERV